MLAPRLHPAADREIWVTFDSKQSRRLLSDREVIFVRETPPRDVVNVLRNVGAARGVLQQHRPDDLVTNGAGIALSFVPLAVGLSIPSHYIECSARTRAPSLTGRALERIPRVSRYAQDPAFCGRRWNFAGSVFDGFTPEDVATSPRDLRKIVITVGSLDFSFSRLLTRLQAVIPTDTDVLVQAGTDAGSLLWPGARIVRSMAPDVLGEEMRTADVVIAHGGIGSALAALTAGKMPLLVPRRKRFAEHVDDHQEQIASTLSARGLATAAEADEVAISHLHWCARHTVAAGRPAPFDLLA